MGLKTIGVKENGTLKHKGNKIKNDDKHDNSFRDTVHVEETNPLNKFKRYKR